MERFLVVFLAALLLAASAQDKVTLTHGELCQNGSQVQCICHGTCQFVDNQASCRCDPGWSGSKCQIPDGTTVTISKRCRHTFGGGGGNSCADTERCLPDNLSCFVDQCPNPIGWCLPPKAVNAITAEDNVTVTPGELCQNGGQEQCVCHGTCQFVDDQASCRCDPGWSGSKCQIPDGSTVTISKRCRHMIGGGGRGSCADTERCLPDNLNCLFDDHQCPNPIGWCLPPPAVGFLRLYNLVNKKTRPLSH